MVRQVVAEIVRETCPACFGTGLTEAYCLICRQSIAHSDAWWTAPENSLHMPCGHSVGYHMAGLDHCERCHGSGVVRKEIARLAVAGR